MPDRSSENLSANLTQLLRSRMQAVDISSLQMLSKQSGVSRRAIDSLRNGNGANLKYTDLAKLAAVLKINVDELISRFIHNPPAAVDEFDQRISCDNALINHDLTVDSLQVSNLQSSDQNSDQASDLQAEYQLLVNQLEHQKQNLRSQLIREAVQTLESLILQLPSAIYAAQQNPQLPAKNILPLLRPLDLLLQKWEVIPIGTVGAEVSFDPQEHQLMDGIEHMTLIADGDRVLVRYVGYRFGDRLLYRARVSPISN